MIALSTLLIHSGGVLLPDNRDLQTMCVTLNDSDYETVDDDGNSCSWYDSNAGECGNFDFCNGRNCRNGQFTASVLCCACGGGETVADPDYVEPSSDPEPDNEPAAPVDAATTEENTAEMDSDSFFDKIIEDKERLPYYIGGVAVVFCLLSTAVYFSCRSSKLTEENQVFPKPKLT